MSRESYPGPDVRGSFEVARDLATRALHELDRSPERIEASRTMRGALDRMEDAGRALESRDPESARRELRDAREATNSALVTARACNVIVAGPLVDLASDLLEQTMSALDRAKHRVENATSCHTTYGAIRMPPSERLP